MDPNTLRDEILRRVGEHQATDSGAYLADTLLVDALDVSLADVQKQIRILESSGLLDVAAAFGPSYGVRLTPQGELALEGEGSGPTNPIGF